MQGRKDFRLRLRAGVLTLELVPSLGGAVSAFRLETRAGPFDLFRSLKVPEGAREDALHAGCFPMVPFANCIRDNRFGFEGRRYAVSPNMAGSRLNFHGSGWQSAWQVAARALDRVELRLGDGRVDGVYRYEAVQLFELDPRALTLTTTLRNRGERAMPFSFGQHPWFPRHGGMLVRFRAGAVLHHVTMSYDIDADKMVEVLRIGREKLSDKGTTSAKKRVDPLRTQTGLAREVIIQRMVDTFAGLHRLTPGQLGAATLAQAEAQAAEKFSTPEWTAVVP